MTTKVHPRMIQKNVDSLSSSSFTAEPATRTDGTAAQAGDLAYSDGTASTNGFGTSGAGFYQYDGATWTQLGAGSVTAATLAIADAGGYYAVDFVENALQEVGAQIVKPLVNKVAEAALILDASGQVTLTADNATYTLTSNTTGVADDLRNIIPDAEWDSGDILYLRRADAETGIITIKHNDGGGNIRIPSTNDFALDSTDKFVALQYDGTHFNLQETSATSNFVTVEGTFNGDNATTVFTLASGAPSGTVSTSNTEVYINGVRQYEGVNYTAALSGANDVAITFLSPPPVGTNNILVRHNDGGALSSSALAASNVSTTAASTVQAELDALKAGPTVLEQVGFVGDGATTSFTFTAAAGLSPAVQQNAVDVWISGLHQEPGLDFTFTAATGIVDFSSGTAPLGAPAIGARIYMRTLRNS